MNKDIEGKLAQEKKALRQALRKTRRELSANQQKTASQGLLKNLLDLPAYQNSQHIAVYIAADGEIDPLLLVQNAWKQGKQIYLPLVDPKGTHTLTFLPWQEDTVMVNNKYGIPEPDSSLYKALPTQELDLVLLPLTGFDENGRRMGMGGGYYDRTFSFVREENTQSQQPRLIGLAHECQKVENIPSESWDIPLAGIATDLRYYDC